MVGHIKLLTAVSVAIASVTADSMACKTVNALVTGFLPTSHTSSFCAAWLQVDRKESNYPVYLSHNAIDTTTTLPPMSRTESPSWVGKPACTAVPTFDRIRSRPRENAQELGSHLLDAACKCIHNARSTPARPFRTQPGAAVAYTNATQSMHDMHIVLPHIDLNQAFLISDRSKEQMVALRGSTSGLPLVLAFWSSLFL